MSNLPHCGRAALFYSSPVSVGPMSPGTVAVVSRCMGSSRQTGEAGLGSFQGSKVHLQPSLLCVLFLALTNSFIEIY